MAEGRNPRDIKFELGKELVTRFHSQGDADRAQENFIARFQKGALPQDMPEVSLAGGEEGIPIANVLKDAGLTSSTSEAMRMIRQGAVRIDGERIADPKLLLTTGTNCVCQVGKRRFAQVVIS
jgi:tyrosyl-tRNA synthetase